MKLNISNLIMHATFELSILIYNWYINIRSSSSPSSLSSSLSFPCSIPSNSFVFYCHTGFLFVSSFPLSLLLLLCYIVSNILRVVRCKLNEDVSLYIYTVKLYSHTKKRQSWSLRYDHGINSRAENKHCLLWIN